jgi:uncharacterized membrane protein
MSDPETRFSKARLEMLCDGIFTVAMTLLALELKVPDLPRHSASAEIWRALGDHALSFGGFALTFFLAGQIWIMHHRMFQHLRSANRALVMLTIPFLMFVSFLPFSTSMLTAFGPREPVALTFYLGNQLVLTALLAAQWLVARQAGLLAGTGDPERRKFARIIFIQPICFLVSVVMVYISPRNALLSAAMTLALLNVIVRRRDKAMAAGAPV